jgi:hypothetical protein
MGEDWGTLPGLRVFGQEADIIVILLKYESEDDTELSPVHDPVEIMSMVLGILFAE